MILEALRVLLFGMLGIFLVMAIIFGVIVALSRISRRFPSEVAEDEEAEAAPIVAADEVLEEEFVVEGDYELAEGEFIGEDGLIYYYEEPVYQAVADVEVA